MVKKSLLIGILLFFVYELFVDFAAPAWWQAAQGQDENIIKAQDFIYNTRLDSTRVIIGSSLSCRIISDSLPHAYNLAFSGHSIFDGLNILLKSGKSPKFVFIETNLLFSNENDEFLDDLFSPIQYTSKRVLKALWKNRQPLAIIGDQLYWRVTNKGIDKFKSIFPKQKKDAAAEKEKVLFGNLFPVQVANYSKKPDIKTIDTALNKLKRYVAVLKKKGIQAVFFEMPVNHQLLSLPGAVTTRAAFFRYFPPADYKYIISPDSVSYQSNDGIHLDPEEALTYTRYFKAHISDLDK